LEYWQDAEARRSLSSKKLRIKKPPTHLPETKGFLEKVSSQFALPLHVLVGSSNARKATQALHCHIYSEASPEGSFIEIAEGVSVCSPELCFVQMANELSLEKTIMLGFEFCGSYRLGNREDESRGFRDDLPLTSVAKLKAYIEKVPSIKGKAQASRALQFVSDNSASPMETILTMLLTLPYRLGGYGFEMPILNHPIATVSFARNKAKKLYRCDLFWPKQRIALEYDSEAYHANQSQMIKDAIRRNSLTAAGITLITVTKKQVNEVEKLRELAGMLEKLLGRRLNCRNEDFPVHQARLRASILPKSSVENWEV
jgi:very-short-patch-repair endonuclease